MHKRSIMIQLETKCLNCKHSFRIIYYDHNNSLNKIICCPICQSNNVQNRYFRVGNFYVDQFVKINDTNSIDYQSVGLIVDIKLTQANVRISTNRGTDYTTDWIKISDLEEVKTL